MYHTRGGGQRPGRRARRAALRKRMVIYYRDRADPPVDYKVRILDSVAGASATTRVLIDTRYDSEGHSPVRWSTVGASGNIIEASWQALKDAYDYGLAVGIFNGNGSGKAVENKKENMNDHI